MAVAQQTPVQPMIPAQNFAAGINPNQMTDLIMSNIIFSKFGDILKGDIALTGRNILKLFFLMSLTEMKTLITYLLSQSLLGLKMSPTLFWPLLTSLALKWHQRKHSRSLESITKPSVEKPQTQKQPTISLEVEASFLAALYVFLNASVKKIPNHSPDSVSTETPLPVLLLDSGEYQESIRMFPRPAKDKTRIHQQNLATVQPECTFTRELNRVTIKNTKETHITEKLSSIIIEFGSFSGDVSPCANIQIILHNTIEFTVNTQTQEVISTQIGDTRLLSDEKPCSAYVDLLTKEQREAINTCVEYYKGAYVVKTYKELAQKIKDQTPALLNYNGFSELLIAKLLVDAYPTFDLDRTFVEVVILTIIVHQRHSTGMISAAHSTLSHYDVMAFDPTRNYKVGVLSGASSYTSNLSMPPNLALIVVDAFRPIALNVTMTKIIKSAETTAQSTTLYIELIENSLDRNLKGSPRDLHQIKTRVIKSFLEEVYQYGKKARITDKVKIFYLLLESEITTEQVPNPEYLSWTEKKEFLMSLSHPVGHSTAPTPTPSSDPSNPPPNSSTPSDLNKSLIGSRVDTLNRFDSMGTLDLINLRVPPKTITREIIKKKIISRQLNEVSKDMINLYLRKSDKERLLTNLSRFRDKKDIIASLGLSNKLNILLYGEPGTGKSSTIQAVATYLRKDIYYVDLKMAATNEDLQMMFEYVNKNVANGGIVVMEDIDAMTNVVLKRATTTQEYTVSETIANAKSRITLEYFLNVLQGTLTLDDSIFIVTTNHYNMLDPAFCRDGRFDVKLELKMCDHYQINAIFQRIFSRHLPKELLKHIPENKYTPATIIHHLCSYMFSEKSDEEIMEPFIAQNLQ